VPATSETEDTKLVKDDLPPLLPDEPLPPIKGVWDLVKASLAALTFTTPNPFQNYREGLALRGQRALPPVTSTGADTKTPSAGKVIVPSKEKLKPKYVDPNEDYEMYGEGAHGDGSNGVGPEVPIGSDVAPEHQKHIEPTKNRLADIKTKADKGDKEAQKKWNIVVANLTTARNKAKKGDEKSKNLVAVLEATGLFKQ
jgi:hypothetical protein